MASSSKKQEARRRQELAKALKKEERLQQSSRLPEVIAQNRDNKDDADRFTIGHQHYRDDICMVKSMKVSHIRKVFEAYKNISRCITEAQIFNLPMDIKSVTIDNHYKRYVTKLSPDVELNEFDAGDYRGFFFIDKTNKIAQMVAVDIHPEDKKQTK